MQVSNTVIYLANQIVLGKLTYLQVVNSKTFTETHPEYKAQLDYYIEQNGLVVDKTK
jgi:hypothetical protein